MVKEIVSFTIDKHTMKAIKELVARGQYRNKSHAVESLIKTGLKNTEIQNNFFDFLDEVIR